MARLTIPFFFSLVLLVSGLPGALATETIIHAGRMLDVKTGKLLIEVSVSIKGNKITNISEGYIRAHQGSTVIDLKEYTLLPGLMDMHAHLCTVLSPTFFMEKFVMDSADYAFRSVVYARDTLLAGFTTVRDLGDQDHNVTMALRDAIQAEYVIGPRIYASGKGLATIEPAKLLNIDDRLGSIEVAKLADLVAVKGDPLKEITLMQDMKFVMKDGIVYKQE